MGVAVDELKAFAVMLGQIFCLVRQKKKAGLGGEAARAGEEMGAGLSGFEPVFRTSSLLYGKGACFTGFEPAFRVSSLLLRVSS